MQAQENTIEQTVTSGVKKIGSGVVSVFNDFKTFVNKGNVVQIAVGIIIGAAFTVVSF